MARMEAGGTLWGLGLALLCVLLTHDILTNRKHSWVPSALTTLAAAAVSANFGWLLFVHQSEGDAEGGKDHTFLGMVLLLSLLALGEAAQRTPIPPRHRGAIRLCVAEACGGRREASRTALVQHAQQQARASRK